MKHILILGIVILTGLTFVGCDDDDDAYILSDNAEPQPPQGVFSVTLDGAVEIWFAGPYDSDVAEFAVYRATSPAFDPPSQYDLLFTVEADDNPDLDLVYYWVLDDDVVNGETYWYAVATVDHAGHVSDLSAEDVFDTPRPEGVVSLYDYALQVNSAGFNFFGRTPVSAGSVLADVYVDRFDGIFYLNAGDTLFTRGTEIQDMGYTGSWDAIGYAPTTGWSNLGYAEIIMEHTYVVRTDDNHYVKMRVIDIDSDGVVQFQWAYQTDPGNPELIAPDSEQATETSTVRPAKSTVIISQ